MGYHARDVKKGEYGKFSKVIEEFEELLDAHDQEDPVLELCEMSDLIGAMDGYAVSNYGIGIDKLVSFMCKTKQSFKEGKRI